MAEKYEYGNPIPEKYRNRLFEWKGGGYDGCFWQMNQGIVDVEGHWQPIFSTGYDGIDQDHWYKNKIEYLKTDLGYDVTSVSSQHQKALYDAIEQVFGKKWYSVQGNEKYEDPRVKKLMEKEDARYAEFVKNRDAYRIEKTHRLDGMFMQVVLGEMERDDFHEIGLIDKEHIKETCRIFCESYKCDVGMMSNLLDGLDKLGYSPWCTCSDCGEQFQLMNYETFGSMIDSNAYHGDGGIGCIMTRILCEECRENTECRKCCEPDKPNPKKKAGDDWVDYDFLSCVLLDWIDVCWGCSSGFDSDELSFWDKTTNRRERKDIGRKFDKIEEDLKEAYGLEKHELYEKLKETVAGRKRINEIRDLLMNSVSNHFENSLDECWFDDRLDTDSPGQMKLPGME